MFCPNCGCSMSDNDKFCTSCGHRPEVSLAHKRLKNRKKIWIPLMILLFAAIAAIVWVVSDRVSAPQSHISDNRRGEDKEDEENGDPDEDAGRILSLCTEQITSVRTADSVSVSGYTMTYDGSGRLLRYVFIYTVEPGAQVYLQYDYEYHEDGRLSGATISMTADGVDASDGYVAHFSYTYENGILKEIRRDGDGEYTVLGVCNEDGLPEGFYITTDTPENGYLLFSYEYDRAGSLICSRKNAGLSSHYSEFTYDSGKITEHKVFVQDELQSRTVYEYDRQGNQCRADYYTGDTFNYRILTDYTYDEQGIITGLVYTAESDEDRMSAEAETHRDGNTVRASVQGNSEFGDLAWEWEYDRLGNIIRSSTELNSTITEITRRYEQITVPADYEGIHITNPVWLIDINMFAFFA